MQRLIPAVIIGLAFSGVASGQQPLADLVQAGVDAYNRQDVAYFEKTLAPDVVWLDDDGHAVTGRERVLTFLRNQLSATPPRKLTVTNIRTGNTGDAAWASFAYVIEGGPGQRKGLNSTFYKKSGDDWQIVLIHGAINTLGHGH